MSSHRFVSALGAAAGRQAALHDPRLVPVLVDWLLDSAGLDLTVVGLLGRLQQTAAALLLDAVDCCGCCCCGVTLGHIAGATE